MTDRAVISSLDQALATLDDISAGLAQMRQGLNPDADYDDRSDRAERALATPSPPGRYTPLTVRYGVSTPVPGTNVHLAIRTPGEVEIGFRVMP